MAEQDRKFSPVVEFSKENTQRTEMVEEDGVDGEIDEGEERNIAEKTGVSGSPLTNIDIRGNENKDSRKPISDRRRHHRHHHSSHRERRRRMADVSDFISKQFVSDEDWRSDGRPTSKHRLETIGDLTSDPTAPAHLSPYRKPDKGHGHHSQGYQPRSRQTSEGLFDGSELLECEDPLNQRYTNAPKQKAKGKLDQVRSPDEGEAEDGEILEDGELNDEQEGNHREMVDKDSTEGVPSKLSRKESSKGDKHHRKKSEHKNRRKRENDDKVKRKKSKNVDKLEDESNPTPAWGSGYQGPKPKVYNSRHLQQGRGCHSPPGLYDSPSDSDKSEAEAVPRKLLSEGYNDTSAEADEKEGIFNPKLSSGKNKNLSSDKNGRKRGRNLEGKYDGPPRKRPLVDHAVNDRPACKFYLEGKCAKGSGCQFNHDVEKPRKMEICKYHLTVKGCIKQRCIYMHEDFPCKYYHTGAKCYSGDRCKFSHDPLTEETRRALEMRVAAEDIIDMEDPDYDYAYRPRESHSRPSLLGSPPRHQQDVKKIPSLFEIEVHPPGQSPKPLHQAVSRPSGFYGESTNSPKPGVGHPGNSPNMGMINNSTPLNQQTISNQGNMGGPGLLQTPLRPCNIMVGTMGRPTMIMNIQHGLNNPLQRPGGGTPIQFLGPGQINNNQQGGNLPPVLNMLGAIIRKAAMQQGPGTSNGNMNVGSNGGMGPSDMLQNIRNLGSAMALASPNNMQHGNMSMVPNRMVQNGMGNIMLPNNIQPNSTNNMEPLQNMMGLKNMMGNMGANTQLSPHGSESAGSNSVLINNNIGFGQEVGIMDVDYRIKPEFGMEEANKDISELDRIRQQIQAQIDKEDEEDAEEETGVTTEDSEENCKMQIKEEELSPMQTDSFHDLQDLKDDKTLVKTEVAAEVELLEIPADLPKKQRELFKRIQQQQLLREKERKRQEALKVAEETKTKADDDDWYSSDEDIESDKKPKLEDVLKNLSQKPAAETSCTSSIYSSNPSGSPPSSTLNIIQMINAIKNQTTAKPLAENLETPSSKFISTMNSHQQKETILSSTSSASAPTSTTMKSMSSFNKLHISELTVEPPAVNAHPVKSVVYSVVLISLDMPKPYTQLPNNVSTSDPAFKDDPRVKWHLQHLEKQIQKAAQRRDSSDGEKHLKKADPRLKKRPLDPRLAKSNDSHDSRSSDPRLQKVQTQSRPADPRLTRQVAGNLDPRLGRQNSKNNPDGPFLSGPVNSMAGEPMNNMVEVMNKQLGGVVNQLGGPLNQFSSSRNNTCVGGLVDNAGSMSSQINSQLSGSGRQLQGGGGPVANNMSMLTGPMNNIVGHVNQVIGPFIQRGTGTNQMIALGGLQAPAGFMIGPGNVHMIGSYVGNVIRGPNNQQHLATMSNPQMNSLSVPRTGAPRIHSDPRAASDPRLRNRLMDPQEQRMLTKELLHSGNVSIQDDEPLKDSRFSDDGSDNYRSLQDNSRGPKDFRESPSYIQDDAPFLNNSDEFNLFRVGEEGEPQSHHRIESNGSTQPAPSSKLPPPVQYSDTDEKPTRKFDYRNDPRFKRVKRLTGGAQSAMEYSSPLGSESVLRDFGDGQDPSYNDYIQQNISTGDPHNRNAPSPSLPDTLQDFDLPNSSSVTVQDSEIDLKVKDLFKTIDPTASPFC